MTSSAAGICGGSATTRHARSDTMTTTKPAGLAQMRAPFPPNQVSYLPKGGTKLAYVGHAALTDRLLDVDPAWSWEPLALGANGLPVIDDAGGLWIRLTVLGVTRLGYGDAGQKKGGDAMKERIGDALRNAAMRFGAALDLWHKGELHVDDEDSARAERRQQWLASTTKALEACVAPDELKAAWVAAVAAAKAEEDSDAYDALKPVMERTRDAIKAKLDKQGVVK